MNENGQSEITFYTCVEKSILYFILMDKIVPESCKKCKNYEFQCCNVLFQYFHLFVISFGCPKSLRTI